MSERLKMKLLESDHPVGVKKKSRYILPPEDHIYGLPYKMDPEGVSIVTRSWKVHEPSQINSQPKDYIKMNQKNTVVRVKECTGRRDRDPGLPPKDFVFGIKTREHTPIKEVINNYYGNKAEEQIRKSYGSYFEEKNVVKKLVIKKSPHYQKLLENMQLKKKELANEQPKPLYKLKMFEGVGSRVAEGIKQFKTYKPCKTDTGLQNIISDVQQEIKEKEKNEMPLQNS